MRTPFFERHQDYVMSLGTIAPGQLLQGFTLKLDPDAPFVLRAIAVRCQYDAVRHQAGLQNLALRYTGQGLDYKQQAMIPVGLNMVYFGQQGNPKVIAPSIQYPQNGVITVDLQNQGSTTLTNVQLFFRGVKLFAPGVTRDQTYPRRMSTRPWTYCSVQSGTIAQAVPTNTSSQGTQYIFRPQPDSDFVLRSISWGPVQASQQPYEIFMTLQDVDNKAYSNAPVHLDVLCSNPVTGVAYPINGGFVAPVGTGQQNPGLFFSEIYVPKNSILYFNLVRNDSQFGSQTTVDIPLIFNGAKVYPQ